MYGCSARFPVMEKNVVKKRLDEARQAGRTIDLTPGTLTLDEVAVLLAGPDGRPPSRPTMRSYVRSGSFERAGVRTIRLGRSVRFVRSDVLRMLGRDEEADLLPPIPGAKPLIDVLR
jgi:hypothetical protein